MMRLIGEAAGGMFLLESGEGRGRLLHLRDDEVVLFDEHRLDPQLVRDATPRPDRAASVELIARLVLQHGEADGEYQGTLVL